MTDMISKRLVYTMPEVKAVAVERRQYSTPDGPLAFDLYRPAVSTNAAVVFVSGYPDPGLTAILGKPLMEWVSYQQWARLVAATGACAVTYPKPPTLPWARPQTK